MQVYVVQPGTTIRMTAEYGVRSEKYRNCMRDMTPWTCRLKYQRRQMTTPFFMGRALSGEPEVRDVLECLFLDASAGEMTFDEFCREFGYDTDSRRAYDAWEACRRTRRRLRNLLGDDYDLIRARIEGR